MTKNELIEALTLNGINPLDFTITTNANGSLSIRQSPDSPQSWDHIGYLGRALQNIDDIDFKMYRKTIVIPSN